MNPLAPKLAFFSIRFRGLFYCLTKSYNNPIQYSSKVLYSSLFFTYYYLIKTNNGKETEMITVSDLSKGDILKSVNHGFELEIKEIGNKNTRWVNLETGEKVKTATSKFNFMLREGVFVK
jgi:hypothetical protein